MLITHAVALVTASHNVTLSVTSSVVAIHELCCI